MTEVEICNAGLRMLGESARITSFDDGSKFATMCKEVYPQIRDEVLEIHEWKCVTAHKILARQSASPDNPNFEYQFQLPGDFVRAIETSDSVQEWIIEQDMVLTNYTTCTIKYIKQLTDPAHFSPLLAKTIAARVAADIAFSVTKSVEIESKMELRFGAYLLEARNQDNRGKENEESASDLWVEAQDLA
jgi:hypothetical protein